MHPTDPPNPAPLTQAREATNQDRPLVQDASSLPLVVLASASARRRSLLQDAGIAHTVRPATIDDGTLTPPPEIDPAAWVASLAFLKARSSLDLAREPSSVVLGADTVCVHQGEIIGQPRDRAHARATIERMMNDTHEVLTGVAILSTSSEHREVFVDRSVVRVGPIPSDQIEAYLDSGQWEGKAGAYNITERRAAGWPIDFQGDEHSIVGLPMARVIERLRLFVCD